MDREQKKRLAPRKGMPADLPPIAIPIRMGFWSAVLVTIFNLISSILMVPSWILTPLTEWHGIEAYASTFDFFQIASMIPGFLVILSFLPLMVAIHFNAPLERRGFSMLGIAFGAIATTLLSYQYYSQFTVVQYNISSGEQQALGLFVLGNPHSFFWPLEVLGYGFMSLSTLWAGFVFSGSLLERCIRCLLITNGALGIGGIIAYPLNLTTLPFLFGLALWILIFPVATILLAIHFRMKMKSLS